MKTDEDNKKERPSDFTIISFFPSENIETSRKILWREIFNLSNNVEFPDGAAIATEVSTYNDSVRVANFTETEKKFILSSKRRIFRRLTSVLTKAGYSKVTHSCYERDCQDIRHYVLKQIHYKRLLLNFGYGFIFDIPNILRRYSLLEKMDADLVMRVNDDLSAGLAYDCGPRFDKYLPCNASEYESFISVLDQYIYNVVLPYFSQINCIKDVFDTYGKKLEYWGISYGNFCLGLYYLDQNEPSHAISMLREYINQFQNYLNYLQNYEHKASSIDYDILNMSVEIVNNLKH